MSTLIRVMAARSLAGKRHKNRDWSSRTLWVVLLSVVVLISAFALLYFKDLNRRLFIHYQHLKTQADNITIAQGKLILEKSVWVNQSRIQQFAQQKLNMILPEAEDIVLVDATIHSSHSSEGG